MAILTSDQTRFSQVVKEEYAPETRFCRDVVTVNDNAGTFPVGTVLGKVTANGKYKIVTSAAVDGSQNAAAIVIADNTGISKDILIAAATDTKVLVLTRGPVIVAGPSLTLGTGATLAAVTAALLPLGIVVESQA
jgi:hypothetical protein